MKNCPNCGAAYDIDKYKCPYCGTSYFDMSMIDFDTSEPIYLRIKAKGIYITQLVKPTLENITMEYDSTYATDNCGNKLYHYVSNRTLTTNITFQAIPKDNTLMTVKGA